MSGKFNSNDKARSIRHGHSEHRPPDGLRRSPAGLAYQTRANSPTNGAIQKHYKQSKAVVRAVQTDTLGEIDASVSVGQAIGSPGKAGS